jgi:ABC-type phosphate transport system substrate-binding protein
MVGVPGDSGVSGYVAQTAAEGAISYTEYSYAAAAGFPVAKVLNAAGYYTAPTPGHVAVSLLQAQINQDTSSPLYLTANLSQVYTDTDPRTYELSSYSYMIVPTDLSGPNFTTDKGYTLGALGQFALCLGQSQVDPLGYSALPINLVEAGFAQLRRIPGNQVPATDASAIAQCPNPTFSTDGTNTLAANDPMPPACD